MSKSLKFTNLDEATAVFHDLPWQAGADGAVSVYNKKTNEYVPVEPGQHIVAIADRYEVHDDAPANAHPAVEE